MSNRAENPGRSTETLASVQTYVTREGARRTVAGWLTTIADYVGGPRKKMYDDAGFRRGRAMAFPSIPGEESRNRDLGQLHEVVAERWLRRDVSPVPSMHSAASRDEVDCETSNVPAAPTPVMPPAPLRVTESESFTISDMKEGPQKGSGRPSRAQSSDSYMIPARISTGRYKTPTVRIWLTVAMRQ